MPTLTENLSTSIGGVSIAGQISRTANGQIGEQVNLAAAKAGTLTTRTDNDTGVVTLSTGHGIITADVVDVYWPGGVHYGMTATVATNAVTVDGGLGDNLPLVNTAVTLCKQSVIDVDFVGDDTLIAAASGNRVCHLHFKQNDNTSILAIALAQSEFWEWHSAGAVANPFAGVSVGKIAVSNGDAVNACALAFGALIANVA